MRHNLFVRAFLACVLALNAATWVACSNGSENKAAASSDSGKIPVTTKSEDARKEFLAGQALADKLLIQDSVAHFDKAIALDPEFASAELARANSAQIAHDFFDHLKKAVSLADKTSEGERLLILGTEAGANGDAAKQKEYFGKLLAAYPGDERVQFIYGGYEFGQQDFPAAIEHLKKATEIAPSYAPTYNMLGYSYRQAGDYPNAEQTFKKYTELTPNDPNPYDSYGELLLKMGRFDDSIVQYRKALAIDPHFAASHFGISADLMYSGKHDAASAELQQITDNSRSDGDLRIALFGMAVVAADAGKFDRAAQAIDKEYAVAQKINDHPAMAADLQAKALILLHAQKYDDARRVFEESLKLIVDSNLSQEIKDNAQLGHHFNLAGVAIGKKDLKTAKAEASTFAAGAEPSKNPVLLRQSHELSGRIALAGKDYEKAISELQQANLQDPQNLYRLAQAFEGKGDQGKAADFYKQAAEFNPLPQLPYAFIRTEAAAKAGVKKS